MTDETMRTLPAPRRRAKLRQPAVADHYVRRQRLVDMLDDAMRVPLCLVVAPAGAGKSTLVAGWQRDASIPVAWLSLDESDRSAADLWTGMIAALETLSPGCGAEATAALRGRVPVAEVVSLLVDDLAAIEGQPAALVLDDLHVIEDVAGIASTLSTFVQNLPPWLHLVLLSRRVPGLPVERLRARGLVAEVHFPELRFSDDEAHDLMGRLSPDLPGERVEAVVARADGWAASLQLAALAARSGRGHLAETSVSGADDSLLVHDYVLREALAGEPAHLVEVLTDVAVARRVNPELARVLTGRADAAELLHEAAARGLFVTRLEPGSWFEVHSLVRTVLCADVAARSPGRLAAQHELAARWFESTGDPSTALGHWREAGRPDDILRVLSLAHASLYDSGQEATIVRELATIPPNVAFAGIDSMTVYAWCHLLVDRRRFSELVEQVTWWSEQSTLDGVDRSRVTMLRSIAATMNGESVEGGALARLSMVEGGPEHWRDMIGRFAWNAVAREHALSERWDDGDPELRRAELALGRDPERRTAFEGTRAVGEAFAGHPLDALRVIAGVQRVASAASVTVLRAELAIAEAIAHRELGDRARAAAELSTLADAPAETMLYCRVLAMCELALLRLDDGEVAEASEVLRRAEALVVGESFGRNGRDWLARAGVLVSLAADDIDAARRWTEQVGDPFWRPISTARVDLASGARGDAAAALEDAIPRCTRHEVVLALVRARSVTSHDEAVKWAASAARQAAEHGLLQTVASEGTDALQLVERAPWAAPEQWMDRLRRASAVGYPGTGIDVRHPAARLTERERDVLRFLPSRLTLREIADELYVSVNTLKYHLKVIYRKLDVRSRAEAAEIARRMTIVPQTSAQRSNTLAR